MKRLVRWASSRAYKKGRYTPEWCKWWLRREYRRATRRGVTL